MDFVNGMMGADSGGENDSIPIDSQPIFQTVLVTVVGENPAGEPVFIGTAPLRVGWRDRFIPVTNGVSRLCFEAKLLKSESVVVPIAKGLSAVTIKPGFELAVAQWPYSRSSVFVLGLRGAFKKPLDKGLGLNLSKMVSKLSVDHAIRYFEEKPYDFWENGGDWLSAFSFHMGGKELRGDERCYGVCRDFNSAVEKIRSGQECKAWLALVREGRFDLRSKLHILLEIRMQRAGKSIRFPSQYLLAPEVVKASEELLVLSIKQALAGPRVSHPWNRHGTPVSKYAKAIFKWNLNAMNRSFSERDRSGQAPGMALGGSWVESVSAEEAMNGEFRLEEVEGLSPLQTNLIELLAGINGRPRCDLATAAEILKITFDEAAHSLEKALENAN